MTIGKDIYAICIDFKTAFDVVDRNMLMYKIVNPDVNGKVYFAIKQIDNVTKSSVRVNGDLRDWFVVGNGVS